MGTLTLVLLFISAIAQGHSQVCSNFPEGNYFEPAIDLPKTCLDLFCQGYKDSGVYQIHPSGRALFAVDVYCDQQTDGGGWTVFQRRIDETVNFYRNWQNYKLGFGEARGNHWLGLDIIHKLLSLNSKNQLRIDMEAVSNEKEFALYKVFNVGDEASGYVLTAKEFAGSYTAGDSFGAMHSGQKFTTFDRDNDQNGGSNCADKYKGSWWYKACHTSNLNGRYLNGPHSTFADGINWNTWKGYRNSLKTTEMKFRETY